MKNIEVGKKYNQDIQQKFKGNYEHYRWFKNGISRAGYEMTLKTIKRHLKDEQFFYSTDKPLLALELGPGHGTWTKEILKMLAPIELDLVDISAEMLKLARQRFGNKNNIHYFQSDFLAFKAGKQYDLFFSVRALEYIEPKAEAIKKISSLLRPGGFGFIITKTPKYWRSKILRRPLKDLHKNQISPLKLKRLLRQNGFLSVKIYPAAMSWPFWPSARMNLRLYRLFGGLPLNFISQFFAESYCVCFKKDE